MISFKAFIKENNDSWFTDTKVYRQNYDIYKNPTPRDYTRIIKQDSNSVRMWVKDHGAGTLFAFAGNLLHADASAAINNKEKKTLSYNSGDKRLEYMTKKNRLWVFFDSHTAKRNQDVIDFVTNNLQKNKNLTLFLPKKDFEIKVY